MECSAHSACESAKSISANSASENRTIQQSHRDPPVTPPSIDDPFTIHLAIYPRRTSQISTGSLPSLGPTDFARSFVPAAARALTAVLDAHHAGRDEVADKLGIEPYPGDVCVECGQSWPCATAAAVSSVAGQEET